MAPGTNIGAASPVGASGAEITGTIGDKVRNDAIANIRSIAEARGRDVDWAVSTVEEGVEILTGVPAGRRGADGAYPAESVFGRADARLGDLALKVREFGAADRPEGA
mgnify:CR=1 FL=1